MGTLLLTVIGGGAWLWLALTATDGLLRSIPLSAPHAAGRVAVDERAGRAIVVSGDGPTTVSLLDTRSGNLLHTITLGAGWPDAVAVAQGWGHAFVTRRATGHTGDAVSMLDTRSGALLQTAAIPVAPASMAVDERSGHVFVVSEGARQADGVTFRGPGSVSVLDARTGTVVQRIAVGVHPLAIAVDAATQRVFVTNGGPFLHGNFGPGTVSILDADTGHLVRAVAVGTAPVAVAVDAGTGRVFVANEQSDTVSMLDARSGIVVRTIPVGFVTALAVDPVAGRVVAVNGGSESVSVLDARSGAVVRTSDVGGSPVTVTIDTRTSRAFIPSTCTNRELYHLTQRLGLPDLFALSYWKYVTVLDTRTGQVLRAVPVTPYTRGVAVDEQSGHAFVTNRDGNSVSMLDATR